MDGGRQKLQKATCYDPYILFSPRPHLYMQMLLILNNSKTLGTRISLLSLPVTPPRAGGIIFWWLSLPPKKKKKRNNNIILINYTYSFLSRFYQPKMLQQDQVTEGYRRLIKYGRTISLPTHSTYVGMPTWKTRNYMWYLCLDSDDDLIMFEICCKL